MTNNDIIGIPINGGISEGGLIVLLILACVLSVLVILLVLLWRYKKNIEEWFSSIKKDVDTVKEDAAIAKEQVANTHDSNFRDDMDEKHTEVTQLSERILTIVNDGFLAIHQRFDTVNDRITGVDKRVSGIDTRINTMESRMK